MKLMTIINVIPLLNKQNLQPGIYFVPIKEYIKIIFGELNYVLDS